MATVTGMTAAAMQAIADGTIVSATVDPTGDLIFTKHDGTTQNVGNVKGSDAPAHKVTNYNRATNYVQNDIVNFAGRLYKSKRANVGKRPPFYTADWEAVSPAPNGWVQTDPFFLRNDWDQWETFWGTGGATRSYTSAAGEFVTGSRALKFTIPAGGSQRIFPKELNLVGGGERVVTLVKARRLTTNANVDIRGTLYQATEDGNPEPFGSDGLDVNAEEGPKTVGLSWQDFTFSNTATYARPQARVNVIVSNNSTETAIVLIDQIYTHDPNTLSLISDSGWLDWSPLLLSTGTNPTMGNTVINGRYRVQGKTVHMTAQFVFGTTFSPGSGAYKVTLPVVSASTEVGALQVVFIQSGERPGYARIEGASGNLRIQVQGENNAYTTMGAGTSSYITPVSGNRLIFTGTYEAA